MGRNSAGTVFITELRAPERIPRSDILQALFNGQLFLPDTLEPTQFTNQILPTPQHHTSTSHAHSHVPKPQSIHHPNISPSPSPTPDLRLPPPLHAILSRLLLPTNNGDITSPAPTPQNNNINNTTNPLSPKDLATAASPILAKIQKARNAVKELPGIETSNEELEEIIAGLEAEVERLNGVESNIKKAVGENLSMLEARAKKKDGEGDGQQGEAMEVG